MNGSVHQYYHKTTHEPVAIKSIRKKKMEKHLVDDMKREIALLAQLDHPNIVKILGAFEDAKSVTLVMEVCTGGELYDNLVNSDDGCYTQGQAAKIFQQMVQSVGYCHKMGVAHRDLKLENFIFESRSPDSQLKLIDFGLSKKYQAGGVQRMKSLVGTAYYMPPEVLNPEVKEYNNKCDVWGLGVILFMMLTGIPPFGGEADKDIMKAIVHNQRETTEEWEDASMRDARDLVDNMLEVNTDLRYSCDQVLSHKWVQENTQAGAGGEQISSSVIQSMQRYGNMEQLKQTAVQVVAFAMSPSEIDDLRTQFKAMDADGSGTVSLEEFRKGMESHAGMEPEAIEQLFAKIDDDSTGLISYSEFIAASLVNSDLLTSERLSAAFDRLDPDQSGYITSAELQALLKDTVDANAVAKFIADADAAGGGEGDGKISKGEFLKLLEENT